MLRLKAALLCPASTSVPTLFRAFHVTAAGPLSHGVQTEHGGQDNYASFADFPPKFKLSHSENLCHLTTSGLSTQNCSFLDESWLLPVKNEKESPKYPLTASQQYWLLQKKLSTM